jgi:hypothetical protein
MSQTVITKEIECSPALQLVATEASYQAVPDKALIGQIDSKTIVIDFQKPVVGGPTTSQKSRRRFFGRVYGYAVVVLMAASACASAYSLLTLLH